MDLLIVWYSPLGHEAMTLTVGAKVYAALSNPVAMETNPAYTSVHRISKCIHDSSSFSCQNVSLCMYGVVIELADLGVLRLVS